MNPKYMSETVQSHDARDQYESSQRVGKFCSVFIVALLGVFFFAVVIRNFRKWLDKENMKIYGMSHAVKADERRRLGGMLR